MSKEPYIDKEWCEKHPDLPIVIDNKTRNEICSECGLVVEGSGPEWRALGNDKIWEDQFRVGAPENPLPDGSNLGTSIESGSGAAAFAKFGKVNFKKRKSISSTNRTLKARFNAITQMAERLNLSTSIEDRAKNLFKEVREVKKVKGKTYTAVAAACLAIACRQEGMARLFKEFCEVSTTPKKEIGRCYKLIVRALDATVGVTTTEDFIPRFCSNLSLAPKIKSAAAAIAKSATEKGIVYGSAPHSVAAAAIYMASQVSVMKRSRKEIASVAGVAENTIYRVYKLMKHQAKELFPKNSKLAKRIDFLPSA